MPNNYMDFVDEFKAGLQPADILTLLAGLRNTVPVYAALGATGTNEGHDEELARRWSSRAKATIDAPPNMLEPLPSQVELEQMMHRLNYPNPQVFGVLPRELSPNTLRLKAMVDAYNRQASDPYSPTTATRRKDFEEAPMRADQFMSAAPKKKKFAKGGSVKKSLDEMMAEMAQKGVKVADKPDLARRGFLGLGKASDFPLAKLDKDMFKNAPAITEKTVTVDPGKGATKSTLKSISETPMSRREVLKSTAGQVLQGMLPKGLMPDVGNVAKQISDITTPMAPTKSSIPAMMAAAIKAGMNEEEAVAHVASQFAKPPRFSGLMAKGEDPAEYLTDHLERLHGNISEPYINYSPEATGAVRPSKAFQELIDRETESMKPLQLKPIMRELKSVDEKMYSNLIKAAKDRSMASVEDLLSYPGVDPSVVDRWMKGELKSLPPSYRDKLNYDEYNKGGSVKKTLDEIQAEIAQKLKPQPQPDLSRRKFFGLGKAEQLMPLDYAMKLNSKDPAFQEALALYMHDNRNMFKNAPAVTEKTVTVDPGKGAAKSTLKSLSETPMSRREVLQSAAGQVMRGVLPDLGGLSAMGNVAKVAETAAAPTALPSSMIAPLLAQAAEQGMKLSDALKFVRSKVPNADELFELEETFRNYKNPSRMDYEDDLLSPSDVMRDLLAAQEKPSIMAARPEMRAMRGMAPKKYEELKDVSRDFSMQSIENALGRGVLRGEDEVEMFLRGDPKIWEIIGNR